MFRALQLVRRCSSAKPSLAFQALYDTQKYAEIEKLANPKLDALVDVVLSLNNRESEYLNLILT